VESIVDWHHYITIWKPDQELIKAEPAPGGKDILKADTIMNKKGRIDADNKTTPVSLVWSP
jgi:hypothetical protein